MRMSSPSPDLSCVCTSLRKASRAVSRAYDVALDGTGMTTAQFALLRNIDRVGDIPLSRLADLLVMDRTSLYRALTPLERQGWVAVAPASRGRTRIAALTKAGRAAMDRAAGPWREAQARLIGALGSGEWATLETLLRGVVDVAGPGSD